MTQIGEISFVGKIAHNIKSDDFKKKILERLDDKYGVKIIARHFVKFDISMISNLNDNPHLICLRSNGNPYFLLLTKINFVNYCIFIDKKIQQGYYFPRMVVVKYHFDDVLFDDTIFDGEMVKTRTKNTWQYLINDIIVCKGKYLHEINLVKRLNILYEILHAHYKPDDHDISDIRVKKYFSYDELCAIEHHQNDLDYTCRGIYFKPLFLRFKDILMNFDDSLVKKVERPKYSKDKDFLLIEDKHHIEVCKSKHEEMIVAKNDTVVYNTRKTSEPDVYELFDEKNNLIGNPCINSMKISKKMRKLFESKNMVDKIEISYEYSNKFQKYLPVLS